MKHLLKKGFCLAALFLLVTGIVSAQSTIPYTTGFDSGDSYTAGDLNGQSGWTVPTGTASVTNADKQAGDQAVMLNADTEVRKAFTAASVDEVWVDAYFKGAGSTATPNYPSDPKPSAIVHFSANDGIQCFNGDGAGNPTAVNTGITLVSTQWYRISIYQKYSAHTWDCYVDAVKKNASPLGFLWNDVTSFNGFINFSGETSYLDTFRVLAAKAGDANGDNKIDIADVVAIVNLLNDPAPDFILKSNAAQASGAADSTLDNADLQALVSQVLNRS